MLNRTIIMGRMTRDPELRKTQSGTSVASFTLAVERNRKNQDGTRKTDFLDVVAWRGTAEYVCKYFSKGRMAIVEGSLQMREWKDRDGNNRHSIEIMADNVYFGDSKRDGNTAAPADPADENGYGEFTEIPDEDCDLPFEDEE